MNEFFSTHEAALALHHGLAELGAIDAEKSRWEWEAPDHVRQDRDRAAAKVRAAVRYLCADTDEP